MNISLHIPGIQTRESIRIILTHTALHLTPVKAEDIQSLYLQYPTSEKHYIFCGPGFGLENVGNRAKTLRTLYGGKSAGFNFWHHLRRCMAHVGFESPKADTDVWMRQSVCKDGETK